VNASEAGLAQVFLNLLRNAAHAIPEGHVDDHAVTVRCRLDAHTSVVVEIADTGSGIPRELRSRVFSPFFTTKPAGIGTGLGLSICHRIVTDLDGEISFETEVGQGTLFRVSLPASRNE
jgi:signal transduction histidine kinase